MVIFTDDVQGAQPTAEFARSYLEKRELMTVPPHRVKMSSARIASGR